MKKPTTVFWAVLAAIAVTVVFAAASWMTYERGQIDLSLPGAPAAAPRPTADAKKMTDRQFTMVCETTHTLPVNGFDAPPKVHTEMLVGGLDLDAKTGWYQGQFAISETRKGSLIQEGSKATVSRPALFERFGAMVIGEQFTLDRSTGEFLQSLTLKDGRKFDLIKGYCGKLTKAPF